MSSKATTAHKLYPPELYRLIHTGNEGDVEFYTNACRDADTILELGCGFGRILAPLARAGHTLTGVDLHPGLLAEAAKNTRSFASAKTKKNTVELIQADMCTLDLGKKFDRVLLAYNALFCLEDDDQVRACFQSVARHLNEDGLFIFDVYPTISLFEDIEEIGDESVEEDAELYTSLDQGDHTIDIYESSVWTPSQQRYIATYHYVFTDKITDAGADSDEDSEEAPEPDSFVETHSIHHRYLTLDQIRDLLTESGLRIDLVAGDFDGSTWDDEESEHLIVVASLA